MICVFVLIFIIIIVIQCIDFVLVHYLLSFMNLKFYIEVSFTILLFVLNVFTC